LKQALKVHVRRLCNAHVHLVGHHPWGLYVVDAKRWIFATVVGRDQFTVCVEVHAALIEEVIAARTTVIETVGELGENASVCHVLVDLFLDIWNLRVEAIRHT